MCNKIPTSARKLDARRSKEPLIRLLFNPTMFLGEFLSLWKCLILQYIRFVMNSWFSPIRSTYIVTQVLLFNTTSNFRCVCGILCL